MTFEFSASTILLDVEGTTSSISFVHDQMFPFAAANVETYLAANWDSDDAQQSIQLLIADSEREGPNPNSIDVNAIPNTSDEGARVVATHVRRLIDEDKKSTGLKDLQGKIWKSGFESGELKSHLYEEVAEQLRQWKSDGLDLRIYSSGSIAAQKLFFRHTIAGDLSGLFTAHYDTTYGGKKETCSYDNIVKDIGSDQSASDILFISDVAEELSAANQAGLQIAASVRPGNKPLPNDFGTLNGSGFNCPQISSFSELAIKTSKD